MSLVSRSCRSAWTADYAAAWGAGGGGEGEEMVGKGELIAELLRDDGGDGWGEGGRGFEVAGELWC
tara:strand:+ start:5830 stop:6027 length:198 start_codon:yes stop_codon:yes gene_type:complete